MTADVGANAPDFELESDAGTRIGLRDFNGEWLVLYFYPRDNTPGCTREAQAFTKAAARLRRLGARVAGVSRDSVKSHCSFRDKIAIGFPLLSDPELTAHKSYGAWGEKLMYGKRIQGTLRTTFLIAPNGRIAEVWKNVRVDGHADAVVAALTAATTAAGAEPAAPKSMKVKGPAPRGARGGRGAKVTKSKASKARAAKVKASKAKGRTRARRT